MGLFDKKFCDICGEKIGLLGNRKLEDGNLCKDCAKKLSPWFSERRHSTVSDIKQQLEYREANKEKVAAFHTTRTLGKNMKVLFDEDAEKFMVSSARDLKEANPDVLSFSDVTGCRLDIDEDRTEIMRKTPDGKEHSYIPPRYTYSYDFNITINVNNPYFDEINFRLNDSSLEIDTQPVVNGKVNTSFDPAENVDYREYVTMGEEIKSMLLRLRQDARDNMAAAAKPKQAVTCPSCGATTVPDANGCCEYCGGALN